MMSETSNIIGCVKDLSKYVAKDDNLVIVTYDSVIDKKRGNFMVAIDDRELDFEEAFNQGFVSIRQKRFNLLYNVHYNMLIYPEKRYDILTIKEFGNIVNERFSAKYPQSIFEEEKFEVQESVIKDLNSVGKQAFEMGLLPIVESGTYGNVSSRYKDGFVITGRNVDKSNININNVNYISKVEYNTIGSTFAQVFYKGLQKPSIDSAIHGYIYKHSDHNAIFHIHTERYFANHPITSYNYPCGSDMELQSIIDCGIESKVIQLKKHGIVTFGQNLQECLNNVEEMFKGVSIENCNTAYNEHVLEEFLIHVDDVYGENKKHLNNNCYYLVRHGNDAIGMVYLDMSLDIPEFAMYIIPEFQGKIPNVGMNVVSIVHSLVKSYGFNKIRLFTTEKCSVANYYKRKHRYENDNELSNERDIYLIKEL
ncbi:L-fuculose phosphate aldolase [compost metagenome]